MSELTTSRINRQFRSLRSKCVALNAFTLAPSKPAVSVTYGRNALKRAPEPDDTPPLVILQSLDKLSTRLHFDRAIVETMQLSKRIYEVRDAFKHIIQSTFGPSTADDRNPRRILPLTAICARVVGEHIQSEVAASTGDDSDPEHHTEDDSRMQVMEELYEQVPSSYRHYTMVAHALTYILETCPHHPTLLYSLLEVCISHSLIPEAHTVLFELFITSIRPRPHPASPCPLTHPAHKNFLSMLRDTCSTSEHPSAAPLINDRTFVRILIDALSQPCPEQLQAWTSKAVTRVARDCRKEDFAGCFVPLCTTLAHTLAGLVDPKRQLSAKSAKNANDALPMLRDNALERLAKWVVSMLDTVRSCNATTGGTEVYRACVDFLVVVEPLRLHVDEVRPTSASGCLVDALCCLATYCLASPLAPPLPAADPDCLMIENLLRFAHTTNDTFDGLVSYTYPQPSMSVYRVDTWEIDKDTPTPPPMAPVVGDGGLNTINSFAAALRARNLLRCEVVLYHQTLRHIEDLISAPNHASPPEHQLSKKTLYKLRMQLMDRIEDAERRCYGGAPGGRPGGTQQPPEQDGEWRWEELVGSWVLKSPAPAQAKNAKVRSIDRARKRRKFEEPNPSRSQPTRSNRSGVHASHQTQNRSDFRVPSNESSDGGIIPYVQGTESRKRKASGFGTSRPASSSNKENGSDSDDEAGAHTAASKRAGNFTTILADAHMNVISLRAEREAKARAQAQANIRMKGRVSAPARVFALPESPASASASRAPQPQPLRRQSSFATILADSHKNVISLREERARERDQMERAQRAKANESMRTRTYTYRRQPESEESEFDCNDPKVDLKSSPVRAREVAEPSSDDALNLFAYPDSSPISANRRRML